MTAPLIAPLIPPRGRPRQPRARQADHSPPTARPAPEVPAVPDDVVYGFGRMDESGRVADRAITGGLGWQAGDRRPWSTSPRRDPGRVRHGAQPAVIRKRLNQTDAAPSTPITRPSSHEGSGARSRATGTLSSTAGSRKRGLEPR